MVLKDTVSVVVPAYNRENYIQRCVESLLAQTYPKVEIVIVDDGSQDETLDICRKMKKDYNNIILIEHKRNMGQSAARNDGVDAANGEWIMFLDSDDTIDKDIIEYMVKIIKKHDVDFVLSCYRVVTAKGRQDVTADLDDGVYTVKEVADYIAEKLPIAVVTCIGTKLYRAELLRIKKKTNQNLTRGEDSAFVADALAVTNLIYYTNRTGYTYYLRETDSVTGSYHPKMYESLCAVWDAFCSFFEHTGDYFSYELKSQLMRYGFLMESLRQEIWYGRGYKCFKAMLQKIAEDPANADTFNVIKQKDTNRKHRLIAHMIRYKMSLPLYLIMRQVFSGK